MEREFVRWHNPASSFAHLGNVPGIELYGDRALVMPSRLTVVQKGGGRDFSEYLAYLQQVGVGPDEVLEVEDLGVLDAGAVRRVCGAVNSSGGALQYFHVTEKEERQTRDMGLSWEQVFGPPAPVSVPANCKAHLRRLGDELGLRRVFPKHRICISAKTAKEAVQEFGGDLILKIPNLASGDGMKFISKPGEEEGFLEEAYRGCNGHKVEIIVERAYPDHVPISCQWELREDGPQWVAATSQIIAADGKTHRGNIVSSDDTGLPGVATKDVFEMRRISKHFVYRLWMAGYRGVIGFDFLKTPQGQRFLLETNGRVTASSYAIGLGRQVHARLAGRLAVAMAVCSPSRSSVSGFCQLRDLLGERLFDGQKGIVPMLVRLLPEKVGLLAVERSADYALESLREAEKILSATE